MQNHVVVDVAGSKDRNAIISLLQAEKLPVEDLSTDVANFFVAKENGLVIGSIGMEIYERNALLRSLVVKARFRKMKLAAALINELEKQAREKGLENIYLLTETAQEYFSMRGYHTVNRNEAPLSLQKSSEFSHVCPSNAILMKKVL
jgi:amino-acid N-acetyltransferase